MSRSHHYLRNLSIARQITQKQPEGGMWVHNQCTPSNNRLLSLVHDYQLNFSNICMCVYELALCERSTGSCRGHLLCQTLKRVSAFAECRLLLFQALQRPLYDTMIGSIEWDIFMNHFPALLAVCNSDIVCWGLNLQVSEAARMIKGYESVRLV